MKTKILLFLMVVLLNAGFSAEYVYICQSTKAYAYHPYSDCYGLSKCKAKVEKVTLEQAKNMKRKLCGYCEKRK